MTARTYRAGGALAAAGAGVVLALTSPISALAAGTVTPAQLPPEPTQCTGLHSFYWNPPGDTAHLELTNCTSTTHTATIEFHNKYGDGGWEGSCSVNMPASSDLLYKETQLERFCFGSTIETRSYDSVRVIRYS